MIENPELLASQLIVQIGLFFAALIAIAGGTLQMYLGQPDTSARIRQRTPIYGWSVFFYWIDQFMGSDYHPTARLSSLSSSLRHIFRRDRSTYFYKKGWATKTNCSLDWISCS